MQLISLYLINIYKWVGNIKSGSTLFLYFLYVQNYNYYYFLIDKIYCGKPKNITKNKKKD